jgi:site-specific DNA-methyltransferase (cytosine-N4-specific)
MLLMSVLEDVSYTRKDGQYLRWDGRAEKIVNRNQTRIDQGKKPFKGIHKGQLPTVQDGLVWKLDVVIRDIADLQQLPVTHSGRQHLIEGNTLLELPKLESNQFDAVITSPPYANRYDYTRTYALELAYLNIGQDIFQLRQDQLSCTVENKPKNNQLRQYYIDVNAENRYEKAMEIAKNNIALQEINRALETRNERGEINNRGVLRMIDQYFTELTLIYVELYRVCKAGAKVAFVNDNVRYGGEVIPVDVLSTSLAEAAGFEPIKIYVIPQRKGNSSQQMKRFGRRPLRKSITFWQKPL